MLFADTFKGNSELVLPSNTEPEQQGDSGDVENAMEITLSDEEVLEVCQYVALMGSMD